MFHVLRQFKFFYLKVSSEIKSSIEKVYESCFKNSIFSPALDLTDVNFDLEGILHDEKSWKLKRNCKNRTIDQAVSCIQRLRKSWTILFFPKSEFILVKSSDSIERNQFRRGMRFVLISFGMFTTRQMSSNSCSLHGCSKLYTTHVHSQKCEKRQNFRLQIPRTIWKWFRFMLTFLVRSGLGKRERVGEYWNAYERKRTSQKCS